MSDSEGYEAVTVGEEGVTVTKRFEADEFPVPAIAFDVESTRGETVRLVLREQVPDGVAVEDLGFHPEYGSEYWTIDEDEITFEREIEPDSEYTTVYGIRATGTDNVERFLAEPSIETVDPPQHGDSDDDTDVIPGDGGEVVRDVIAGEADTVPGVDDANEDGDEDEEVEPLDLNDPDSESRRSTATVDSEAAQEPAATTTEDLIAALTAEIESGESEDIDRLRSALGIEDEPGSSVDARVDRIQRDVSNLRAYTDALEEFLDEEGTAEEVLNDLRSRIEELEGTVEDVEETVEKIDSSVTDLESDVAALREDIEDEDLVERLETMEGDLEDLQSWQTQIKQTFGGD